MILGSADFEELATRADYLARIEEFDSALAHRVEQVRDEVRVETRRVAAIEARADAYDPRLAARALGNLGRARRSRIGCRRAALGGRRAAAHRWRR